MRAYPVEIVLDTLVYARDTVRAPMAETFAAVRATYAALKLPREWADSANGQLGTLRARLTYQLGGERLSQYFNCGQGLTGANADTWRLTIAIVTFLQPAGEGKVRLGTGAVAEAQDMSGVSTEPAMCGSSGLLEARILRACRRDSGSPDRRHELGGGDQRESRRRMSPTSASAPNGAPSTSRSTSRVGRDNPKRYRWSLSQS